MKEWARWFYTSKAWRKCRKSFLEDKHYICERCGGAANTGHHKEYLTPKNIHDPIITLNHDNLEALCPDCHSMEHKGGSCIVNGLLFDDDGDLIQCTYLSAEQ